MGLALDDPGFDHTVLAEFRARVAGAGLEQVVLDALLERLAAAGLVRAGGKQRTDSTYVIAAVAALNRLELAGESVRAALEALAAAHPAWLEQRICVPDFARRYGIPMTSWRPPASQGRRDELAIAHARDGYALLAIYDSSAPGWLRELPAVDVVRRVLVQNYTRIITRDGREVIRRREKEPRATVSRPVMRGSPPRMTPTPGAAPSRKSSGLTAVVHDDLAAKNLAPGRHCTDSGYLSAALVVSELARYGIALIGPVLADNSAQARAGHGYARADFTTGYDTRTVTCPQGKTAATWTACTQRARRPSWPPSPPATAAPARPAPCAPPAGGGSSRWCPAI